jgi:hypothetical protein
MPRTYTPRLPPGEKRRKAGGRGKGTPNKSTIAIREAVLQVFADLQDRSGEANGHLMDWALGNATDFYRLSSKLLPRQVTGEDGGPVITRVELVPVRPGDVARERGE